MIKMILIPFLLTCSLHSLSQTQFVIRSAIDSLPLPFASIINLSQKTFYSANENGQVIIHTITGDSIRISYVGFKELLFIIPSVHQQQQIYIKSEKSILKEVIVKNCKLFRKHKEINYKSDTSARKFGGVISSTGESNGRVAVYVKSENPASILESITFWLKRWNYMPKYAVQSPFAITLYSCDKSTGLPDALLYERSLFYFPKKEGKQIIHLDSLRLVVPDNGLFVSFEFIMDKKYQWELPDIKNDTVIIRQGVNIEGAFADCFPLAFFDYTTNNWKFAIPPEVIRKHKLYSSIKMEAVFKYCDE